MDFVMINQLPELAVARNRVINKGNNNMTVPKEKRNPYLSKWQALFDNVNEQWISFQPKIGRTAYPCFACRDMFANRNSFVDHINRRGLVLKYSCPSCDKYMTFYNICSFLVHARTHFTDSGGSIDLENVDISTISMDIAGFMPHPDYPRIFDVEDTAPDYNLKMNVKFYKPKPECLGTRIVFFESNELIFHSTIRSEEGVDQIHKMMLCQVCSGIPKCEFVAFNASKKEPEKVISANINNNVLKNNNSVNGDTNQNCSVSLDNQNVHMESDDDDIISIHTVMDEIICLDDDSSDSEVTEHPETDNLETVRTDMIKVKSLKNLLQNSVTPPNSDDETGNRFSRLGIKKENQLPQCQECGEEQIGPMKDHFQQNNRPVDDNISCSKCSLILPSICALRAHIRIHTKKGPYVCPECGKDFDVWHKLFSHMEDVCFHLAKHIRYKCPAKKCGKIFAQTVTFSTHLPLQHIKIRYTCDVCAETFTNQQDFNLHSPEHTFTPAIAVTSYECMICNDFFDSVEDHVKVHCYDCDIRIYVYTCKYCRSYYRSKNTYAAHLLRCAKLLLSSQIKNETQFDRNELQCKIIRYCKKCDCKIQFHCAYKDVRTIGRSCPKCHTNFSNMMSDAVRAQLVKKDTIIISAEAQKEISQTHVVDNVCLLCNAQIDQNVKHNCKYQYPVVFLTKGNYIVPSPDVSPESSITEDNVKRKRKRNSSPLKNKKIGIVDETYDMLPIKPIIFNGEYNCKICEYKDESREKFHEHIQSHRDVSTAYQCMECGECFVVKPTLIKHLQVFHLIENVDTYFNENECFDKDAVRELQENMKMCPGETAEPVGENQCRVCRQIFSDNLELSKHFRGHGMAFLMKKITK